MHVHLLKGGPVIVLHNDYSTHTFLHPCAVIMWGQLVAEPTMALLPGILFLLFLPPHDSTCSEPLCCMLSVDLVSVDMHAFNLRGDNMV